MKNDHGCREAEIRRQERIHIVREPSQATQDTPLEFLAASEKLANARKRESKGRAELYQSCSSTRWKFCRSMRQNKSLPVFRPYACEIKASILAAPVFVIWSFQVMRLYSVGCPQPKWIAFPC